MSGAIEYRRHRGGAMIQVVVAAAVVALLLAWMIPVTRVARDRAAVMGCQENLRRVGMALREYAGENAGSFPVSATLQNPHADLVTVLAGELRSDGREFYCPAERKAEMMFSPEHVRDGIIDYYYYSAMGNADDQSLGRLLREIAWPRKLTMGMPGNTWLMSDIWNSGVPTTHAGYRKGLNYLTIDGSVAFISEMPRRSFH